jgi:alpha-glucosidase
MIDLGLSGWMADFGEYVPADGAVFYSNQTGREVHNQWPTLWAEVNRNAIDERNVTGDVVFWMRAGSAGIFAISIMNNTPVGIFVNIFTILYIS